MSQPAIIPARHEIWYTDGGSGFYVVRLSASVWPHDQAADLSAGGGRAAPCSLSRLTFRLRPRRFGPIRRVRVLINDRAVVTRTGRRLTGITVSLPPRRPLVIRVLAYDRHGLARSSLRRVTGCSATRPRTVGRRPSNRRRR
jgi:hypothetical protein